MLCEVYGGKANVEEANLGSGGAGTNVAVGLARLGIKSSVIAEIGNDIPAQLIIDELMRENVDTSLLVSERDEQTGMSAVLVASDGSRSALTYRGAAHMLSPSDIPFAGLEGVSWIHLSSIGNTDLIREIFLFCKQHNIRLSWNPSKAELEEVSKNSIGDFEKACTVIFVNDLEFDAVKERQAFLEQLGETLVITKGKKGGEIRTAGTKQEYEGKVVEVVCELGAGDAFASGFIGACILRLPVETAIEWGVQNSASVVGKLGAKKGLLSREKITA